MLGFFAGVFQSLGSILGVFLGYFVASRVSDILALGLEPLFFHRQAVAEAVAFILVFLLINRLIGLICWILAKAFQWLRIIPFVEVMNRVAGALLGFIEGMIVIGIILQSMARILPGNELVALADSSQLAQVLLEIASWYDFLLPSGMKTINLLGT